MKDGNLPGTVIRMSNVVMPDDLAVCGIKKWNAKISEPEGIVGQTPGIPFCLGQNILRTKGQLLRFDNAQDLSINAQGIVGGTVVRGVLSDGAVVEFGKGSCCIVGNDLPAGSDELGVYLFMASQPFGIGWGGLFHLYYIPIPFPSVSIVLGTGAWNAANVQAIFPICNP
ncbi:MAG: hypothetical protein AB2L22_03460 [Syntrophales bacterium]